MALTPLDLYAKYQYTINRVISSVKKLKEAAIPGIVATISTEVIPGMMADVGHIKELSGAEKRELIIKAIELAISEAFKELNKLSQLAKANWDEVVRDHLLVLLPPLIRLLIDVENNDVRFNKKPVKRITCC